MTPFIHDDFLLESETAKELYHRHAAEQPIIDYHCHLPPADLAGNRRFDELAAIWLAGDHYKWRAMRINGEAERLCTGDAPPYEKFLAFARTVPKTLRNPLHHWTHLELKRYFGIDVLLDEETAPEIWEAANARLADDDLDAWGILNKFKVRAIGSTDDPADDLAHHRALGNSECPARVLPSFRPDKAFAIDRPGDWNAWIGRLEAASGIACAGLDDLLEALGQRIDVFDALGCVASDHGLGTCPERIADRPAAAAAFDAARSGREIGAGDAEGFAGFLLTWLGERYCERGWAMQLHLGALRNANDAVFEAIGPDAGCDSIDDRHQIAGLKCVLGALAGRGKLPKVILYNLNPADNYAIATMCGNFFGEGEPGKVQFGSGWWFLDQLEGMTWQLNALSNLGLLAHFVGMLTDSRSFMSYPRHEYFRRLLCNLLGNEIERGLLPRDLGLVGGLVEDVCHGNARRYFGL